jgi:DnaJ-domain-containing protein 1
MAASEVLRSTLRSSNNPLGVAGVVLLAWIAYSDGEADEDEMQGIREIAAAGGQLRELGAVLDIAKRARTDDLKLCCDIVRQPPQAAREDFMRIFIATAIADGFLKPAENHVLRFISDALAITPTRFRELFAETTGKQLPAPSDLSDPDAWGGGTRGGRTGGRSSGSGRSSQDNDPDRRSSTIERIRALAILGLEEGASREDVTAAYRRLAKVHHPDRFSALGAEAEKAATITFQRIKAAYELLSAQ